MRLTDSATSQSSLPKSQLPSPTSHLPLLFFAGIAILFLLFFAQVGRQLWSLRQSGAITTQSFSGSSVDTSVRAIASQKATATIATLDDANMGKGKNPALTIVSFVDFGCPYSAQTAYIAQAINTLQPLVRFVVRDFPIASLHPQAPLAAEASECADEQGKYFAYYDKLFREQDDLSEEALRRYAREIGLDTIAFDECLSSHRYTAEVTEDRNDAIAAGVRATPTFFFNGVPIEGAIPESFFHELVSGVLAKHASEERP